MIGLLFVLPIYKSGYLAFFSNTENTVTYTLKMK